MLTLFTVILAIVLAVVVCIKIEDNTSIYIDTLGFFFIIVVSILISIFLGMFLEKTIYNAANKTQKVTVVAEMIAMSDSTALGRTYVRTYGTQESYIFRYAVKGKFGDQVKELKNSDEVYIVQTNEKSPAIVEYCYKLDNGFLSFLVSESIFDDDKRTEVIVPVGTMKEDFDIDLE